MIERKNAVVFKGGPVTLIGPAIKVGDKAPSFSITAMDLSPVSLADYAGKVVIIVAVPSIDTPVCDMEVRRFNAEAGKLSDDIVILTISMDLPFAQSRWCGAAGVTAVTCLSDYKDASFGKAFGALIKELHLLARSCFVVDKKGIVIHAQYVPEITHEPDYDSVIKAAKAAL